MYQFISSSLALTLTVLGLFSSDNCYGYFDIQGCNTLTLVYIFLMWNKSFSQPDLFVFMAITFEELDPINSFLFLFFFFVPFFFYLFIYFVFNLYIDDLLYIKRL